MKIILPLSEKAIFKLNLLQIKFIYKNLYCIYIKIITLVITCGVIFTDRTLQQKDET